MSFQPGDRVILNNATGRELRGVGTVTYFHPAGTFGPDPIVVVIFPTRDGDRAAVECHPDEIRSAT